MMCGVCMSGCSPHSIYSFVPPHTKCDSSSCIDRRVKRKNVFDSVVVVLLVFYCLSSCRQVLLTMSSLVSVISSSTTERAASMIERMESQESTDRRSCWFVKFLDNVGMGYTRSRFDEGALLLLDTNIDSMYCRCCLLVRSSVMQDMVLQDDSTCVVLFIVRFLRVWYGRFKTNKWPNLLGFLRGLSCCKLFRYGLWGLGLRDIRRSVNQLVRD